MLHSDAPSGLDGYLSAPTGASASCGLAHSQSRMLTMHPLNSRGGVNEARVPLDIHVVTDSSPVS